ncbi:hypothetical protein A1O7_02226 [Cladophialophora yegresii CBS 114405]|uniref:Transcription initiation factor TFIID subunit 4 n=1 Tax=Cladophialophora yegresii CBS 114405 TaxID=1182544 RepID=W9WB70_9EURO|nr:uncharacterized protein A1O7_02226 [Cladophialophora yegresii CBS 114405]EXJ61796.1 hypothetical protein A1O7_02226 [Cladophialophora yegresii CBS 114405]
MAHSPPAPSRPPLPQTQTSFPRDFSAPNGRPSPLGPQSPPVGMNYASSSPQAFSPQQYFQPPAAKRPRLSPDIQSPSAAQSFPGTPTGLSGIPASNTPVNSAPAPTARPATLMPPPQRPPDKEDRSHEDILAGTGINIEEESRLLVQNDYFGGSSTSQTAKGSFQFNNNSLTLPGSSGGIGAPPPGQTDGLNASQEPRPSEEEMKQRLEERADWEESRHSQHPLWDMFLLGGALNERIRNISITEHLVDPQSGVLVNTQKHMPPPTVRVNGLEGASRVIDKGQAILDTQGKGERLSDIMKVINLAAQSRITGLLSASSRLAKERRQHSKGKIPDEWQDIAAPPKLGVDLLEAAPSPAGSSSLKRTHSQANSQPSFSNDPAQVPERLISTFDKVSYGEKTAEEMRRQKRSKRRTAAKDEASATPAGDSTLDAASAALEAEKKTTKKERKLAETKFTEQQQHKSANEAARMAVAGILGNRKKAGRTFDWMNAGKAGASPAATPGRPPVSGPTSTAGTPAPERTRAPPKDNQFGHWDEDKDARIQARDVLLVLESDGRASRSYLKGVNLPEKSDS